MDRPRPLAFSPPRGDWLLSLNFSNCGKSMEKASGSRMEHPSAARCSCCATGQGLIYCLPGNSLQRLWKACSLRRQCLQFATRCFLRFHSNSSPCAYQSARHDYCFPHSRNRDLNKFHATSKAKEADTIRLGPPFNQSPQVQRRRQVSAKSLVARNLLLTSTH